MNKISTAERTTRAAETAADLAARTHSQSAAVLAKHLADGKASRTDLKLASEVVSDLSKRVLQGSLMGAVFAPQVLSDAMQSEKLLRSVQSIVREQGPFLTAGAGARQAFFESMNSLGAAFELGGVPRF